MNRKTEQREAIQEALLQAGRPLTAGEILKEAKRNHSGLGIATVYRNVKRLSSEGWLLPVEIPGSPTRYEVAGKDHHHYFVCRICNRALEVHDCPSDLKNMIPKGFKLEHHEVVLYGLCSDCVEKGMR